MLVLPCTPRGVLEKGATLHPKRITREVLELHPGAALQLVRGCWALCYAAPVHGDSERRVNCCLLNTDPTQPDPVLTVAY